VRQVRQSSAERRVSYSKLGEARVQRVAAARVGEAVALKSAGRLPGLTGSIGGVSGLLAVAIDT